MQAAENRHRSDAISGGQLVAVWTRRNRGLGRLRNSGAQGGVRAAAIVVACELFDGAPGVPFVERDEIVEALPADRANQSFAEGIGGRDSSRSLQDVDAEAFQFAVEARRKDPVAVVNQESVRMAGGEGLAELPDGPIGGGWAVTLVCSIRRDSISMATKTYRTRNVAVTDTKKSQATTAPA